MTEKRCCHCKRTLPISEFHKNSHTKDGYCAECMDCRREYDNRVISLDRPMRTVERNKTLHDIIARRQNQTDESYEKVFAALNYWIGEKIITSSQAEVIYLYAVEMFTFPEIGEIAQMHYSTVMYHYNRGIERLRNLYAEVMESA